MQQNEDGEKDPRHEAMKQIADKFLAYAENKGLSESQLARMGFSELWEQPLSRLVDLLDALDAKIVVELKPRTRKPRATTSRPPLPITQADIIGILKHHEGRHPYAVALHQHLHPDFFGTPSKGKFHCPTRFNRKRTLHWKASPCFDEAAVGHQLFVFRLVSPGDAYDGAKHIETFPPIPFPNKELSDSTPVAVYGEDESPCDPCVTRRARMILNRKQDGAFGAITHGEPYFGWLSLILQPESLFYKEKVYRNLTHEQRERFMETGKASE